MNHDMNLDFSLEPTVESSLLVIVNMMNNTGLCYDDFPMFINKDSFSFLVECYDVYMQHEFS